MFTVELDVSLARANPGLVQSAFSKFVYRGCGLATAEIEKVHHNSIIEERSLREGCAVVSSAAFLMLQVCSFVMDG